MSTEELYTRLEREITERLKLARRASTTGTAAWTYEDGDYYPTVRVGDHQDEVWTREAQAEIWRCDDELDGCPEIARELRAEGRHIAANDPAHVIRACERDLWVLRRHSWVSMLEQRDEAIAEVERLRAERGTWRQLKEWVDHLVSKAAGDLLRERDEAIAERDRLRVIVERANWCDCGIGASKDGLCDNSALATQPHAENCPACDRVLAAEAERLRYERGQYKAESERLGDVANRLVQRVKFERDRANEAAQLSAEARDVAEDLRAKIANQGEAIADLESQRLDLDAWAVRVCTESGLYELPLDVDDEFGAIAKAFRVYRKDLATSREAFDVAVKGREDAIAERDRYAEVVQAARVWRESRRGRPSRPLPELADLVAALDRLGDDDG